MTQQEDGGRQIGVAERQRLVGERNGEVIGFAFQQTSDANRAVTVGVCLQHGEQFGGCRRMQADAPVPY